MNHKNCQIQDNVMKVNKDMKMKEDHKVKEKELDQHNWKIRTLLMISSMVNDRQSDG